METPAYIDADIVAYRCAASCEPTAVRPAQPVEVALARVDGLMKQILEMTGCSTYRSFISGPDNWRKDYYSEYKANRKKTIPPKWLQECKGYLVQGWDAQVSTDALEADDEIAIAHTETPGIICSIDKDFQQLAGEHFNFVTGVRFELDEAEANRFFYKQCIIGDKSDNVPGWDGQARQKPTKYIQELWDEIDSWTDPVDMYMTAYECFMEQELFEQTANLLWLWRKNPDEWVAPDSIPS